MIQISKSVPSVGWEWWTGLELLLYPFSRHTLDLEPPQSVGWVFRERSWAHVGFEVGLEHLTYVHQE